MKEIKRHLKKPIALIVALMMLVTMIPFISAPVYAETEITDVHWLFDEDNFTLYQIGQIEKDANAQFLDLVELRAEDKDKYYFFPQNAGMIYRATPWNGLQNSTDPISAYREYFCIYSAATKPGYVFSSNREDMNFYINGVKVTAYEQLDFHEFGDGTTMYQIYMPAGPPAPKYDVKPQKNVKVKLYGHDDIHATWDAQIIEGAEVKYRVEYKRSTWSDYKVLNYGTTGNYRKKANLVNGARYKFRITPFVEEDGIKYEGGSSESPYIYTLKKIAAPRVSKSSRNYVRLRWTNIPGESGYQISRSRYKTKNFTTVKRVSYKYSTTRIKTPRNRTYYYKIRAYKTVDGKRIYAPWSAVRAYKLR